MSVVFLVHILNFHAENHQMKCRYDSNDSNELLSLMLSYLLFVSSEVIVLLNKYFLVKHIHGPFTNGSYKVYSSA